MVEDAWRLDVCLQDDCIVGGREVAGVLLNYGEIVVEGYCHMYGKREQSCGEASYATKCMDGGEAGGKWGRSANCNPDVAWCNVEEAEARVWKA